VKCDVLVVPEALEAKASRSSSAVRRKPQDPDNRPRLMARRREEGRPRRHAVLRHSVAPFVLNDWWSMKFSEAP
jgi:hypothetical protein